MPEVLNSLTFEFDKMAPNREICSFLFRQ
ncbi:hypothetical protein GQ600_21015 [Phytophthora cactorum]|nr:hypothetical protein GQ600_21015 [Phytophthora cactorum]